MHDSRNSHTFASRDEDGDEWESLLRALQAQEDCRALIPSGFEVIHSARAIVVYATELARILWCEIQWQFARDIGTSRKDLLAAGCLIDERLWRLREAGTTVHESLECELHAKVTVKTTSLADCAALRVSQIIFHLDELGNRGITREMPVFSVLRRTTGGESLLLHGIIDEVRFDRAAGLLHIHECKTRATRSIPAQMDGARVQLMIYALMLGCMLNSPPPPETIMRIYACDIDATAELGPEVQQYLATLMKSKSASPKGFCLGDLADAIHDKLVSYSGQGVKVAAEMSIRYVVRPLGTLIGCVSVQMDSSWLSLQLDRLFELVHRTGAPPSGVTDLEEAHIKCGTCDYAAICEWRESRHRDMLRKNEA